MFSSKVNQVGKVNTIKELENSWIRWSSLVASLSNELKEAIKRFSSRACWIIFSIVFDKRAHPFLWSTLKRADYPLSVILFCFIDSYFCYLHNWPVNTAWLSTLLYFIPAQGVSRPRKRLKKKTILQWWDRGDIYNNLCCKIHSTVAIWVKLFDHSHSVNNNNNKMLLVGNNISS